MRIIHNYINRRIYQKAIKLLSINFDDNNVFFEFDDEISYVMDFAINDIKTRGKTLAQLYQKDIGGKSKIQNQILQAMISSYTSLFRVEKTNNTNHAITLYDLLNNNKIKIIDYHLNMSLRKDILIFCRVLCFDGFSMTSGIEFVFPAGIEKYLLTEYEKIKKKIKRQPPEIVRFVAFFMLNRTDGNDVMYVDPP